MTDKLIWGLVAVVVLGVNVAVFAFFGPPVDAMFRIDLWAMAGAVIVSYAFLVVMRGSIWAWLVKVVISVIFMFYLMITDVNSLVVFAATIVAFDLAATYKTLVDNFGPW